MLPSILTTLRAVIAAGGVRIRNFLGDLVADKIAEEDSKKIPDSDNYDKDESYRLAKMFKEYLKNYLRMNISRTAKNSPFTKLVKGRNTPLYNIGYLSEKYTYIKIDFLRIIYIYLFFKKCMMLIIILIYIEIIIN
jgi:hypothetical protein